MPSMNQRRSVHNGPRVVKDGIVACWDAAGRRSYPGTGTTWYDMSGNGNDGTLTSGPTFDPANGGSIDFDGSDDYVTMGDVSLFDFGTNGNFSLSLWFKRAGTGNEYLIVKGDTNASYWLRFESDDTIRIMLDYGGTNDAARSIATYTDTNWHHVVGVADRVAGITLWIDGVQDGADLSLAGGDVSNTYAFSIGAQTEGTALPFNGKITAVSVYDRALTAAEILQNYLATRGRFI